MAAVLSSLARPLDAAVLGRWISRDPIKEEGCINVYCFCGEATRNYQFAEEDDK